MKYIYERRIRIPAPAAQVFAWHEREDAFSKLIPPGEPVKLLERSGGIRDGAKTVLLTGRWPFQLKWIAIHDTYVPGRQFRDVQQSGPFKTWAHTHQVMPDGLGACVLIDHIEYELPLGALGEKFGAKLVRRKLDAMFDWRHQVTYRENAEVTSL